MGVSPDLRQYFDKRDVLVELTAALAKRDALYAEMHERIAYDALVNIMALFNKARGGSYSFRWYKKEPEQWPRYDKVREPVISAWAMFDRSSVDVKTKIFSVYPDAEILYGPGYRLPPDEEKLIRLLEDRDSLSMQVFNKLLCRVQHVDMDDLRDGQQPKRDHLPTIEELQEVTDLFFLRY